MQRCRVWPGRNAAFLQPHKTQYFVYKSTFEVTLERGKIHSASTTTGTSGTNFAHKTSAACSYLQLPVLLAATPKALPQDVRKTLLQIRAASSNLTTAYLAIQNVFILRPSRWPGTCAQPCGPLYGLRSMLSMFQRNIMKYPLHSFELSASIFIKFFVVWTYGLGNSYSYRFSLEPTKGGVNLYSQCI